MHQKICKECLLFHYHNSPNLETTQVIDGWYIDFLHWNTTQQWKKSATAIYNSMDKSHKENVEQKKPVK